jgi:putative oxidoreductase
MLLIAGLMILLGIRARWGAVALILFLIATNIFFHNPSGLPALQARLEMIQMMKNFAIMGGLFGVLVHGTGALSLDPLVNRLLKKRPSPLAE